MTITVPEASEYELDVLPPDEQEVEEAVDFEGEFFYPVEYSITSYGADYPVDSLVNRLNAGAILIPKFQRSFVWNIYRASRFIESLLLGLPVPAIFFSKEVDSNRLLVIDGQQRLKTLQFFYKGVFEPGDRAFKLKGVHRRFRDKTYETLHDDDRLRLDDSIIHAIIVRQEEPKEHEQPGGPTSIYHIFQRLNTGGVLLQPQEIRSCICHGSFIDLLEDLNADAHWRTLFGKVSTRMRDRELILRFFALIYESEAYSKPMNEFLTRFAYAHRNVDSQGATEFRERFVSTARTIHESIGDKAFKLKAAVNAALCDAVMVGVATRLQQGPIIDPSQLKAHYDELLRNLRFRETISSGTTDDANVTDRLRLARQAFGSVR